jgi:hypothetical protein
MTNQFPDATKMVFPPNDLSHLSDEEFNALAPQGYHATGPAEPLSPAAQAVLDAFNGFHELTNRRLKIAAVLRAAADQVVPDKCPPIEDFNEFDQGYAVAHRTHRQALLAIAAELDDTPKQS